MRNVTVRLPEPLVAEIEAEALGRKISKSDVIRERLEITPHQKRGPSAWPQTIADVVGSVSGLPVDLSSRKKEYLRGTGYGQKRHR